MSPPHPPPPLGFWFLLIDPMTRCPGPEEDRLGPVSPAEEGLGERRTGEGGRAAFLRRVERVQTLPPPAELLEQLHHGERVTGQPAIRRDGGTRTDGVHTRPPSVRSRHTI